MGILSIYAMWSSEEREYGPGLSCMRDLGLCYGDVMVVLLAHF